MTDGTKPAPKRVGGTPAFVAAHGISSRAGIAFEHAYLLARLVIEEGGGPVSCRGRNAMIKKPSEKVLMDKGLIEVEAASEFSQRYYLQLNIDGHLSELLDAKFADVKLTPKAATERATWAAVATQEAFDLVAACLSA